MAGLRCDVNIPSISCVTATATCVGFLTTATNQRVKILAYGLFFDGTSNSAQPVQIQFARPTAGTLTTGGTAIITEPGFGETPQTTVGIAASVQPTMTASLVYKTITVHPQLGYEYLSPLGQEEQVKGGTNWVISVTAPATVNCRGYFQFEE
jgi:hypothetical protein